MEQVRWLENKVDRLKGRTPRHEQPASEDSTDRRSIRSYGIDSRQGRSSKGGSKQEAKSRGSRSTTISGGSASKNQDKLGGLAFVSPFKPRAASAAQRLFGAASEAPPTARSEVSDLTAAP